MLRPMPVKFGTGFTSNAPLPEETAAGYRHEMVGLHHNYHATQENWAWPIKYEKSTDRFVIDGFSPNLNKDLHVGHLRNLAIANSLSKMLSSCDAKFVALLGCCLGVKLHALTGWRHWTKFIDYHPVEYFDVALPDDLDILCHPATVEGVEKPLAWDGPLGEVLVKRSDGRPLYAYYDLAFAKYVGPTHYITGQEQKEHFEKLGFDKKHLLMGLVMGADNKKLKSRTGDAMSAYETVQMIIDRLDGEIETRRKLAWNILAWNFLRTTREKNLKFEAESWTRPDQGGLYISYTYARAVAALHTCPHRLTKLYREQMITKFTELDIGLLGFAEQYLFYYQEAVRQMDPAPIANFAFDLARLISQAYEKEKVYGGRRAFEQAFNHATWRLEHCMKDLGMFMLQQV